MPSATTYTTSGYTTMWPLRQAALSDNYRLGLQIITETKHFRWWNVFDDKNRCTIGRWSFWSWFDVNRPTFDEDKRENDF